MLLAGSHPGHVYVVLGEDLHGLLDGGVRQSSCSTQDPGEVDVEEPQDVRAGIHQGRVHIVRGQDPVRGIGQDCGVREKTRKSKSSAMFSPELTQEDNVICLI